MKLNEQGAIIDPNVGDAELVRMDFDSRWIDLHIKLARDEDVFVLRLAHPRWMSFSTNHAQNVIDRIVVTTDLRKAAALAPQHTRDMLLVREQAIPGLKDREKPLKAVYITPTSGPELSFIADDVTAIDVVATP